MAYGIVAQRGRGRGDREGGIGEREEGDSEWRGGGEGSHYVSTARNIAYGMVTQRGREKNEGDGGGSGKRGGVHLYDMIGFPRKGSSPTKLLKDGK